MSHLKEHQRLAEALRPEVGVTAAGKAETLIGNFADGWELCVQKWPDKRKKGTGVQLLFRKLTLKDVKIGDLLRYLYIYHKLAKNAPDTPEKYTFDHYLNKTQSSGKDGANWILKLFCEYYPAEKRGPVDIYDLHENLTPVVRWITKRAKAFYQEHAGLNNLIEDARRIRDLETLEKQDAELYPLVRDDLARWYVANLHGNVPDALSEEEMSRFQNFMETKDVYTMTAETLRAQQENVGQFDPAKQYTVDILAGDSNWDVFTHINVLGFRCQKADGKTYVNKVYNLDDKGGVAGLIRDVFDDLMPEYGEIIKQLAKSSKYALVQKGNVVPSDKPEKAQKKSQKKYKYYPDSDFTLLSSGANNNTSQLPALRKVLKACGFTSAELTFSYKEPPDKAILEKLEKIATVDTQPTANQEPNTGHKQKETDLKEPKYSHNTIIFGAPGTGKSYLLKQEVEGVEGDEQNKPSFGKGCYERVTFHPEYTYFDFVGTYKPVMVSCFDEDGNKTKKIEYRFVPGPFAIVLKKAWQAQEKVKNTNAEPERFLLLIEEINRARMAAVFGDIFQLLDRNDNGESEYDILPSLELACYLQDNEELEEKDIRRISLPPNLYIWATMNSADQGVFPMDTAFKRRWDFEYLGIDEGKDKLKGDYADVWKAIRKEINGLLQKAKINEDKQMGPFFLKLSAFKKDADFIKAFKSKVVMYLYEDAAKHKKQEVFKDAGWTYSEICSKLDSEPEVTSKEDLLGKLRSIFNIAK